MAKDNYCSVSINSRVKLLRLDAEQQLKDQGDGPILSFILQRDGQHFEVTAKEQSHSQASLWTN